MRIDLTKRLTAEELATPVGVLITEFEYVFYKKTTVEETVRNIQSKSERRYVEFLYIIDEENQLLGAILIKDLLYHSPETLLGEIVDLKIPKIEQSEPFETALKLLSLHQILVLPVVDKENKLLGVLEVLANENGNSYKSSKLEEKLFKEDLFQFIGFSIEQKKSNSSLIQFRYRMPWLCCNLFGGLVCALIGEFFQLTLIAYVVLSLFIPLVLTLSESVAIQSMTISLRFIHLKRIFWLQVWRRLFLEWKTSALLAIGSCIVIAAFYFSWSQDIRPILAITISLFFAMVASATFGALFPIILHVLRLDPKVAAGPVILMLTDIATVGIYLSFSTAFLL